MSEQRHPDIEVYVKECNALQLYDWLKSNVGDVSPPHKSKDNIKTTLTWQSSQIPVLIQERVVGKAWTSIWFDSDETPWATDLDCARQISKELSVQTRCILSGWNEGDEPDEWMKIHNDHEEKISWQTH